jgi:flagellar motor switch protein FliM
MAGNDPVDQDAIAAQWEASLDSEDPAEAAQAAAANELTESMALQWAAMVEDGSRDFGNAKNGGGERVLSQEEIDNLLGFTAGEVSLDDNSGIRAIIDSAMVSYERLPMLEIVFDRLVRLLTTSLRNFTSDNVEVSLDRITSVRFGDYMNSIPLPAVLSVFKAEEWENFGLATVDSTLIYSIIDVLLGGRRGNTQLRVEGRPYTTIETNLVKRLIEVVLTDAEQAFRPLSPVRFTIDRLETNPRFAAISRPANAAILVRLRIDMEDRGGNVELLLPYATIEPIRPVLLQMFMGEKFGRDPVWESHFATEISQAEISVDAVLYEADVPLKQLMQLKVGDTLPLDIRPDALVAVRCGATTLTEGRMGRVGDRVAIRVTKQLRKPHTTLAMFEGAEGQNKLMEAQ